MIIKNKQLPKGLKKLIKSQIEMGGIIEFKFKNIKDCTIKNHKIVECLYAENGTEIKWFTQDKIFYVFVNDVNFVYYSKKDGLVYI